MSTPNGNQIKIEEGPYQIVINATPEHSAAMPLNPTPIGYRTTVIVTRLDNASVYKSHRQYVIPQGGIYLNLESAFEDSKRLAREAIVANFPDRPYA